MRDDTARHRQVLRLAGLGAIAALILAALGAALAATPGQGDDGAPAAKAKGAEYEGSWRFAGNPPEDSLPFSFSGLRKGGPGGAIRAMGTFDDADICPTKTDPADLMGKAKVRRAGKNFRPRLDGGRSGYNQRGAESNGNDRAAGKYRLVIKLGKKRGKPVQRLRMRGTAPGCNTDGFYRVKGVFSGPRGGTPLGKRFKGTLIGNEDPPNPLELKLQGRRVR